MSKHKRRASRRQPHLLPARATMAIRDVDYQDAETGVTQLTDEAVHGGREWVSEVQL